jgi:hypothetical protein
MLNKIIERLNGSAADPSALAVVLNDLARDREAAVNEIEGLRSRRHQALLDDANDQELDRVERQIERKQALIEKLDLALPAVRERLAAAKAEARRQRMLEHRDAHNSAARKFITAARATVAAHSALLAVGERARQEGFEREAAVMLPMTANLNGHAICAPDLLDLFENAIAAGMSSVHIPTRGNGGRSVAPNPAPSRESTQHAVRLGQSTPRPKQAERTPNDLNALEPGQSRVRVLRSGWSPSDDQPQCYYGQVIRVSTGIAQRSEGAVQILETYAGPLPQASSSNPVVADAPAAGGAE